MQPTLYTPRLVLRPFTLDDAGRVQELVSDKHLADMTALIPHPYPVGGAEQWIDGVNKTAAEGRGYAFAVTLAGTRTPGWEFDPGDTGHLIGCVSIGAVGDTGSAVLGYWIGIPWHNKGFATEAGNIVLQFAFQRRRYLRVLADHIVQNPGSGRVLQKLGMVETGRSRKYFPVRGLSRDLVHYALTREAWSRRQFVHRWKLAARGSLVML